VEFNLEHEAYISGKGTAMQAGSGYFSTQAGGAWPDTERGRPRPQQPPNSKTLPFYRSPFPVATLLRVTAPRSVDRFRSATVLGRSDVQTPKRLQFVANAFWFATLLRVTAPRSVDRFRSATVLGRSDVQTPKRLQFVANAFWFATLLRVTAPRSVSRIKKLAACFRTVNPKQ